jgi:hypothetical protein
MNSLVIMDELNYCGGRCMKDEKEANVDSEEMFKYKLGKWVLLRDECVFMNLDRLGKDVSMHQHLLESINDWVNQERESSEQEFVSEMCQFIKSNNEDLYIHLMEICALNGISVGDAIFEALSIHQCEDAINTLEYGTGKE